MVKNFLLVGLLFLGGLSAQIVENAGGGSSTLAGLSDVDETSRTEDDVLKVNASGDYVNTNILEAIGEELATSGCVLYESSGSIGCNFATIGGSQTFLVEDTTATTGDTSFIVKAGAGQAANLQEWQNNAGTALVYVDSTGRLYPANGLQTNYISMAGWWSTTQAAGGGINLGSGHGIVWGSGSTNNQTTGLSGDTGIDRNAAGILDITDGSTGQGSAMLHAAMFNDSDTVPTCNGDDYWIRADLSETRLKACEDDTEVSLVTADDLIVYLPIPIDDTAAASTGDGKETLSVGSELNGYVLTSVRLAAFSGGSTSGTLNVDLTLCTPSAGNGCNAAADMLSTNLTMAVDLTSSTNATITSTEADKTLETGDFIRVDIDAVHGTPATGVEVVLAFTPGS